MANHFHAARRRGRIHASGVQLFYAAMTLAHEHPFRTHVINDGVAPLALGIGLTGNASWAAIALNCLALWGLGYGALQTTRDATVCWKNGRRFLAAIRLLTAAMLLLLMLMPLSWMLGD